MNRPSLSLFFPAYNEADTIAASIDAARVVLDRIADPYEIIVVDDGSSDATAAIVERIAQHDTRVRLVRHEYNQGYGAALKTGIASARYDYVFFTDADLQFDLAELASFIPLLNSADTVIGFRHRRQDAPIRLANARLWNWVNRLFFGLKVHDIDCAFKIIRRDYLERITLTSQGAMISAEMLIKLRYAGARIRELSVSHYPRTRGSATGAKPKVILRALRELWRLYSVELGDKTQIQLIKFVAVGVLNTVTATIVFIILVPLVPFARHTIVVAALAYGVGTIVSFIANRTWTFQIWRPATLGEIVRFYTITIGAFLGNLSVVYLFIRLWHVSGVAAVLLAGLFSILWNFFWLKYWVFPTSGIEPRQSGEMIK